MLSTEKHRILIDAYYVYTGSTNVSLYNIVDLSGSLTVNGSASNLTFTKPGQKAAYTFSGNSGQQVTIRFTNNAIGLVYADLFPQGQPSSLVGTSSSSSSFNLGPITLPSTGIYSILIDPAGKNTGPITVRVTSP